MSESDELTLFCWIYRDDVDNRFPVTIPKNKTVGDLKRRIKDKASIRFRDVEADTLRLYSIIIPVDLDDGEHVEDKLNHWSLEDKSFLNAGAKVSKLFPSDKGKEPFIVVVGPDAGSSVAQPPVAVLTLNCWVRGQEIHRIFPVEISATETIGTLKEVIKQKKLDFHDIDAPALKLYKVSLAPNEGLETFKGLTFDPDEPLCPTELLSLVFPSLPPERHVHIVIIAPTDHGRTPPQVGEQDDILTTLTQSFRRTTPITSESVTPSRAANSGEYAKIQAGDQRPLDCRCAAGIQVNTVAPPIQLFNPAFAFFSSKAFDPNYDVPDHFVLHVRDLVAQFALIHPDEHTRRCAIRPILEKAIDHSLGVTNNFDRTVPDFAALSFCGGLTVYLVMREKNEFGDGRSDFLTQAVLSFLRVTGQEKNSEPCLKCCCPTFIIAHAGPWLTIMGGVITANTADCVVQRLTDFLWVPVHSTHDDDQCRRIARVLYALRESIQCLDSWHKSVKNVKPLDPPAPAAHPRFFPSPNAYRHDGALVKFEYQTPLKRNVSCVTYLAKTIEASPKYIVVKFVTSYGVDAHRNMASTGFAPQLLYCGKIDVDIDMPSYGDLRMVVMEYVKGLTFEEASKQKTVFSRFKTDLRRAFEQLHGAGYVFGDLRQSNVIVIPEGTRSTAQLIDFDWAGKAGKVKYPVSISSSIDRPAGVQGLAPIQKEHDLAMLDLLTSD